MENQRVMISKKMLKDTLLKLLERKDLLNITVRELCEESGINRSTFYRHYGNISDVLEEVVDDILKMVGQINQRSLDDPDNALSYINNALFFLKEHKEYDPLFKTDSFIMESVYRKAVPLIEKNLYDIDPNSRRYLLRFLLNGSYGIMRDWVLGGRKEPAEHVSEILYRFSYGVANSLQGQ